MAPQVEGAQLGARRADGLHLRVRRRVVGLGHGVALHAFVSEQWDKAEREYMFVTSHSFGARCLPRETHQLEHVSPATAVKANSEVPNTNETGLNSAPQWTQPPCGRLRGALQSPHQTDHLMSVHYPRPSESQKA